uniref:Uncharacterized protein n=1 Tax=Anguilla anguilla TaxID=7936 RepID=A0A0E9TQS0_ANGAN
MRTCMHPSTPTTFGIPQNLWISCATSTRSL